MANGSNIVTFKRKPKIRCKCIHSKTKKVLTNKVKIMRNETDDKEIIDWSLSIGFYPGILIGARNYDLPGSKLFVFYLPFVDFAFEVFYG